LFFTSSELASSCFCFDTFPVSAIFLLFHFSFGFHSKAKANVKLQHTTTPFKGGPVNRKKIQETIFTLESQVVFEKIILSNLYITKLLIFQPA